MRRDLAVLPQLCLDPTLGCFVAQLQAHLAIDPIGLLVVDPPTFTAKQHMHAPIAVANPRLADLLDPSFEHGLSGAARLVVVGGRVEQQHPTGPSDRHIPLPTHLVHQLALPHRPQSFRRMTSCSISLSRLRSATTLRSLLFSSSSCFSRRISVGSSPSYFFFQLK